ncbi:hypothetical protein [Actinomadura flavalba]|uniref:hypothetical protein n=1 Tax=Actinomadura flavalba TaxID=1120938 RepID=UPI000373DC11|nr:hypothetical protein [Actinomadura flavalba]
MTNTWARRLGRGALAAGAAGVLCAAVAPAPAHADGIYKGTKKGTIDVTGGPKFRYTDKQYLSTSSKNTRSHIIHVTWSGCSPWRARMAVAHPGGGYTTDADDVHKCGGTAYVTNIGKANANVTLTISVMKGQAVGSVTIKPIK